MYTLSKIIPIPMKSCYGVENPTEYEQNLGVTRECATWWQWRGKIYNHRIQTF